MKNVPSATHMEDSDEVPDSSLVVVLFWGVNQWVEKSLFSLSPSL